MNLPQNWNDIKVFQFKELVKLSDKSFINNTIDTLQILNPDLDIEEIEEMDIIKLNKTIKDLAYLRKQPPTIINKTIQDYKLVDLHKISLGEFIDIEHFYTNNYFENLTILASIMYQLPNERYGDYNIYERQYDFEEIPITDIYGIIQYYTDFRTMFYDNYRTLLVNNDEDYDPIPEEEMTVEEKRDNEEEIKQEQFHQKWAWEKTIHTLANGNFLQKREVTERGLIECFNELLFIKENKI